MMYQYWAFGLHVSSDMQFPELLPASFDEPDVKISTGSTCEILKGKDVNTFGKVQVSANEYLLDVTSTARYYSSYGNKIVVEPVPNASKSAVRLFLLSNAMAAILHQRSAVPFHASGIIKDDALILFTGKSGAGKSTTALWLMQQGYQVFTDDVCVLSLNHKTKIIEASASYPMMKLWDSTIDAIAPAIDKEHELRPGITKYGYYLHEKFIKQPVPVKKIFILRPDTMFKTFSCKKLQGFESFNALQQNTYRREYVHAMGMEKKHFSLIAQLTNQLDVFELCRPAGEKNIEEFADFLLRWI